MYNGSKLISFKIIISERMFIFKIKDNICKVESRPVKQIRNSAKPM